MRKNIYVVFFVCLAFLLVAVFGSRPAFCQRSLFEDEEEKEAEKPVVETESSSGIQVPRTAEAKKLADEVLGKLASSYYTLRSVGVGGFDATFTVEEDGNAIGKVAVALKPGGKPTAKVLGVSEDGKREAIEDLYGEDVFGVLVGGPLSAATLKGQPVYATKSDNQFILDMSELVAKPGSGVQACVAFVSSDLRKVEKVTFKEDDEVWGVVYQGEPAKSKLMVGSSTVTIEESGEKSAKIEHTWTYSREQGVVFLKRIRTKITSPGETVNLQIVRDKVTFDKAMMVPEIPDITEDIKKIREMHLEDLDQNIKKALEQEMERLRKELESEKPE